jgi:signal transduction histidine kinase
LEQAALDASVKVFWTRIQYFTVLPGLSAGVWFALEYADLGHWLNRRTVPLLAAPPLLFGLLNLTNAAHHLMVAGAVVGGSVHLVWSIGGWIAAGYAFLLMVTISLVFVWLFVTAPVHRRSVALCLCGQLVVRGAAVLKAADVNPVAPVDLIVLATAFASAMYALALFRFRMFDLIPIARRTVIEQMHEGMLVLDNRQRIVDLNPAAERILGIAAARARGAVLAEVLPACRMAESEITLGTGDEARHYALHHSELKERRGLPLGSLTLLHDVTERRQAQAQAAEKQRALATLRERDRVARELHDGLGQVLGFVKMQAQAARGMLARRQTSEADACLEKLATVAQDAHGDVREYILGARAGMSTSSGFFPALGDYLRRLGENYGLATNLNVAPELADGPFPPMVEAQLLRILQEALTNVRKHARATGVDIRISVRDGLATAIVQDDGAGFDPALLETAAGQKFGLRFMRERAEEVGGTVQVHSAPGAGTRVVISVPLRKELP